MDSVDGRQFFQRTFRHQRNFPLSIQDPGEKTLDPFHRLSLPQSCTFYSPNLVIVGGNS